MYNIGGTLFDSKLYLLNYKETSTSLKIGSIEHLRNCLISNTPKACETSIIELHILYTSNRELYEDEYIKNLSFNATNETLYGNFIVIKWIYII